jgi:hypothetical protein
MGWPNIVARLEVGERVRPRDRNTGLRERREMVVAIDVVSVVAAHVRSAQQCLIRLPWAALLHTQS